MTASAGAEPLCVPMGFMEQKAKRINNLDCRRAERLGVGLLLCAALLLPALPAFGKIPFKRRPKTAAAPKKPTAAPVKKAAAPRKTKAAPVKRAAAPVVTAPAAEIPVVAEPAAIWQGCLQAGDVSGLASRLQLEENQLRRVLSTRELLPLGGSSACLPYVGATGGERGAATAMFHAPSRPAAAPVTEGEKPSLLVVSRTADSVAVIGREFRCPEQARRMVSFPAADFAERSAELLAEVPAPVRWQIDVLVPQMLPEGDGYTVRVGFGQEAEGEREHLHSIEILEAASGKLVDGAWWVERKTGPGVIVGMKGTAYERALWLSPIEFIRKSRGVGPTARTVRRNFAAPPAKGGAKPGTRLSRIVTLRGFHLGVDLTAPTGTPIHAVGDGVVSFVGRKGGYGNLVIVDHGQGYQTYYAHMSAFQAGVKKGTAVTRGEVIGRVGSTGRSTAPHLHFETRKDSKYIDPYDETRQLDFWMLSAEEHERVALQLLAGSEQAPTAAPVAAGGGGGQ